MNPITKQRIEALHKKLEELLPEIEASSLPVGTAQFCKQMLESQGDPDFKLMARRLSEKKQRPDPNVQRKA